VLLFGFVKTADSFDGYVVGFRRAAGENDLFRVSTNQLGNLLSTFTKQ
jgi:hypothetical protein